MGVSCVPKSIKSSQGQEPFLAAFTAAEHKQCSMITCWLTIEICIHPAHRQDSKIVPCVLLQVMNLLEFCHLQILFTLLWNMHLKVNVHIYICLCLYPYLYLYIRSKVRLALFSRDWLLVTSLFFANPICTSASENKNFGLGNNVQLMKHKDGDPGPNLSFPAS